MPSFNTLMSLFVLQAFPGNSGKTDTVKNSLKEFASARFIRFLPTKYNKYKVLRVEAYGILFSKGIYVFSFLSLCWRSNYKGN